jgi:hypothetical protein
MCALWSWAGASGRAVLVASLAFSFVLGRAPVADADEVLDWNAIAVRAMQTAPAVPGPLQSRFLAIVHAAIFDAVNGIERRYTPIHVTAEAPLGASRRAAAVQAAYAALINLRPAAQHPGLAADRDASLARIWDDEAIENSQSVQRGLDWGEQVANAIWDWRKNDQLDLPAPGFTGGLAVGQWRPTPRPNPAGGELPGLPMIAPLMGYIEPFALKDPVTGTSNTLSFRPSGPPPLISQQYATDVNEVKQIGSAGAEAAGHRTTAQTQSAIFWGGAAASVWNRTAVSAALARNTTLSQNARLLALLNVAGADALIVAWEAKRFYELWRPITAIRLADMDGNALTAPDPVWTPLLVTPAYPEYYSGHQSVSASAYAVLTEFFGNDMPVEAFSESLPGVILQWPNFLAAADNALSARIYAGIHYRFAMNDTRANAVRIAQYVMDHAALPLNGRREGQLRK